MQLFVEGGEGLGPILPEAFHRSSQAGLFSLGKSGQQPVTQSSLQHIQIAAQTRPSGDGRNSTHAHPVWKLQGRGKLAHRRTQSPEAHSELMQGLRVAISEHLGLEVAQAAGLTANELQGKLSAGERGGFTWNQKRCRFMESWSHRRCG
jgi:hypothetical protein